MRILLITDGSERSLTCARFLAGLPHRRDVHVHILTVLDSDEPTEGENILAAAGAALGEYPGHVTIGAGRGDSSSEILEAILSSADSIDADLIALGASGKSALARIFLGSIAEAVARYSEQPVLLTRPPIAPLESVVVGLDGSDKAQNALEFLVTTLALPQDVPLHLVRVVPRNAKQTAEEEKERETATASLTEVADILRATGFAVGSTETPCGNPALELIRIAEERAAGLIVVGAEGLSGVDRFRLGSVAERVMRHAPCSVLIVKRAKVR